MDLTLHLNPPDAREPIDDLSREADESEFARLVQRGFDVEEAQSVERSEAGY